VPRGAGHDTAALAATLEDAEEEVARRLGVAAGAPHPHGPLPPHAVLRADEVRGAGSHACCRWPLMWLLTA
jgi:hypothetical protein